jgi:hypothetical protein
MKHVLYWGDYVAKVGEPLALSLLDFYSYCNLTD